MDLYDVMRTQSSCRYFTEEPVPDEVLTRIFDAARFAPSGGNRQPVRVIAVTDPELRAALSRLYLEVWRPYWADLTSGKGRAAALPKVLTASNDFAESLHRVPVLAVVCARHVLHKRDEGEGRAAFIDGASIYPAVQNIMLGCRYEQLGCAITTLLSRRDRDVRPLLGIPDDYSSAACLAIGWPAGPFPTRLRRISLGEFTYRNRFGNGFADSA